MTALCVGQDPELWTTGDDGNHLAVMICRLCSGCPDRDRDPVPHGVIRHGVAHSDAGVALPDCDRCGFPVTDFRGGGLPRCRSCADPEIWIPDPVLMRQSQVRTLARLGLSDRDIAEQTGFAVKSVGRIRRAAGVGKGLGPRIGSRRRVAA